MAEAQALVFGTFLTLSLKLMQCYVTSVSRGSLYEKFGNKCVKKIIKPRQNRGKTLLLYLGLYLIRIVYNCRHYKAFYFRIFLYINTT
jgi:hypothetical protein